MDQNSPWGIKVNLDNIDENQVKMCVSCLTTAQYTSAADETESLSLNLDNFMITLLRFDDIFTPPIIAD